MILVQLISRISENFRRPQLQNVFVHLLQFSKEQFTEYTDN